MLSINTSLLNSIDLYFQNENAKEGRRKHLGASLIGQKCDRQTWYGFRWAKNVQHSGRLLRLFNRGHLEEFRFVEWLRAIGLTVYEVDADGNQFRVSDIMGHFGGSCDGVALFPEGFPGLPPNFDINNPVLLEFKTSGDKSYKDLIKNGMKVSKPQHWAQICTYGFKMDINYFLYMAINKNTDALHIEFGLIDKLHGKAMIEKAGSIITSPEPPKRKFAKGHFECRYCDFSTMCHYNETMEKNCRSCKNVCAIENKQWGCSYHQAVIPENIIEQGCDSWVPADE